MKLKHLLEIVFVVAIGGFIAYKLLNKKEEYNTTPTEEKPKEDNEASNNWEKRDVTMHQVYENMNTRNEKARDILADINDEMKKSEDNIEAKKADIEKMMKNLKK